MRTFYEVSVSVNGLRPGDVIWFDKDTKPDAGDKAAIKAKFYNKIKKPEWM